MGEFTAFSQKLVMQVTPELRALLKVAPKAHPELQVMLIDVQHYKPTWAVGGMSATPEELDFPSSNTGDGNSWTTQWTWTTCTAPSLP